MKNLNKALPTMFAIGLMISGSATANLITDFKRAYDPRGTHLVNEERILSQRTIAGNLENNPLSKREPIPQSTARINNSCLCFKFAEWQ